VYSNFVSVHKMAITYISQVLLNDVFYTNYNTELTVLNATMAMVYLDPAPNYEVLDVVQFGAENKH